MNLLKLKAHCQKCGQLGEDQERNSMNDKEVRQAKDLKHQKDKKKEDNPAEKRSEDFTQDVAINAKWLEVPSTHSYLRSPSTPS